MNQRERAVLINRTNYWGIIGPRDAMHVLSNVASWKKLPNAGWFVWECTNGSSITPNPTSIPDNSYAVAVTQLYSVRENKFYVRKKASHFGVSTALGVYEQLKYDVDA